MNLLTLASRRRLVAASLFAGTLVAPAFAADNFFFSTGNPDGRMAVASRPDSAGKIEIEAADDFALTQQTSLTSASFTGLLPSGASISDVTVEIYRIFPQDSDVGRTSGPPTFSTDKVPTRVNSPSDVAFDSRGATAGSLTFTTSALGSFTAGNSVVNGINAKPNQTTGGDGSATGNEATIGVTFSTPLDLPAGHYFFVPQVQLDTGDFLWLSAPKPIAAPGTPFPAGNTDLQAWVRNANLDPDWLRVGTDIVGGTTPPTFNMTFSLAGTVPDAGTTAGLLGSVFAGIALARRRLRRAA
jgi:hypothetical protein